MLASRAPAKVNLGLHVLGRRQDGYHRLDSLVAFAGVGDLLSLAPGPALRLTVGGPFGDGLESDAGNLVLTAVAHLSRLLPGLQAGHFTLLKRLPIASGIGGGSADAAAALRLVARLNRLPSDHPALHEAARQTGADVPVCLASRARVMAGTGEVLGAPLRLPRLFAVLVNPRVAVPTSAVFARLGLVPGEAGPSQPPVPLPPAERVATMTGDAFIAGVLASMVNDLEAPARALAPVINEALSRLAAAPGCRLARMSGSGATCFGLFASCTDSADAARAIKAAHPNWWIKPTILR
jgi:4-diphosphocytidyl-2-C-methyl-D-erythritol kinase